MCMKFSDLKFRVQKNTFATEKSLNFVWFRPVVCEGRVCESIEFEFISEQIRKPGTQTRKPRNPGPGQILKLCFVPSRTQKYDVTMWRNPSRHICTKFQENRHISGSTIKNSFETWQRHIEPGMWRNVTKMWRHIISSPSLTQTQVQVLGKFRLGTTLNNHGTGFLGPNQTNNSFGAQSKLKLANSSF